MSSKSLKLVPVRGMNGHYRSVTPGVMLRLFISTETAHIYDFEVSRRGRGTGTRVMRQIMELTHPRDITLEARAYNRKFQERILDWYRRLGFKVTGESCGTCGRVAMLYSPELNKKFAPPLIDSKMTCNRACNRNSEPLQRHETKRQNSGNKGNSSPGRNSRGRNRL